MGVRLDNLAVALDSVVALELAAKRRVHSTTPARLRPVGQPDGRRISTLLVPLVYFIGAPETSEPTPAALSKANRMPPTRDPDNSGPSTGEYLAASPLRNT